MGMNARSFVRSFVHPCVRNSLLPLSAFACPRKRSQAKGLLLARGRAGLGPSPKRTRRHRQSAFVPCRRAWDAANLSRIFLAARTIEQNNPPRIAQTAIITISGAPRSILVLPYLGQSSQVLIRPNAIRRESAPGSIEGRTDWKHSSSRPSNLRWRLQGGERHAQTTGHKRKHREDSPLCEACGLMHIHPPLTSLYLSFLFFSQGTNRLSLLCGGSAANLHLDVREVWCMESISSASLCHKRLHCVHLHHGIGNKCNHNDTPPTRISRNYLMNI